MPDSIFNSMTRQEILREMELLQQELCTAANAHCTDPETESALWICRVFPGITHHDWMEISRKHEFRQWITLPLDGDRYPHLKLLQETMEKLSYNMDHDALTGLANRRAFDRTLDIEIERARRSKSPVSLTLLDLDNFKRVNDTYGHSTGDIVLATVGGIISSQTRRYDLAARFGGEEFALILSGATLVRARKVVERILEEIREVRYTAPDGTEFMVTCSAGLTCYKGSVPMSVRKMIDLSDKALYEAKDAGKDQVVVGGISDVEETSKETLVHANEKQFLFGIRR